MTTPDPNTPVDGLQDSLSDRLKTLTHRESEVLNYLVKGMTNNQIALALFRSPKTIDKHCQNIYQKTGIHKRVNLVREVLAMRYASTEHRFTSLDSTQDAVNDLVRKSRAWDKMTKFEAILSRSSGPEYFGNLAKALAKTFEVKMAGVSEINTKEGFGVIIANCVNGELQVPYQYNLSNSACGIAYNEGKLEQFDNLCDRFGKEDCLLVDSGFKSYIGIRLDDRLMGPIGTLWIADDKPIDPADMPLDILSQFAPSVASELAVQRALVASSV